MLYPKTSNYNFLHIFFSQKSITLLYIIKYALTGQRINNRGIFGDRLGIAYKNVGHSGDIPIPPQKQHDNQKERLKNTHTGLYLINRGHSNKARNEEGTVILLFYYFINKSKKKCEKIVSPR